MQPGSNRKIDLLVQFLRIIMVVYLSPVLIVIISIAMVGIFFEGVGGIARRAHAWHL